MLERIGRPKTVVMIGDNYQADVLGAKAVCMPAILVRKENIHHYPFYCREFFEIDAIIDTVMPRMV